MLHNKTGKALRTPVPFKGPVCRMQSHFVVREHPANGVNVNPRFLMSHLTSNLSQTICDVRVKSQTIVEPWWHNMTASFQVGPLFT